MATDDGYTARYAYDLAGNRLGRQVQVVRNSEDPTSEILSTEYIEYDNGNRLRKEQSLEQAIFAAIPWDNDRIFACADGSGGFTYQSSDNAISLGQFKAFWVGLPSVWNRWLLAIVMILVPVVFLWPAMTQWLYKTCRLVPPVEKVSLSLYHRCLCILLAYVFLIGPETFQYLAYADVQYHQLSTQAWGHAGQVITYFYDGNGSQTYKIYADVSTSGDPAAIVAANTSLKYDRSEYNLQNRLSRLTQYSVAGSDVIHVVTEYAYNPDGIRTGSYTYRTINGGAAQEKKTTDYLIDPANPTGYAQVLEERTTSFNASDVPTTQGRIHYTIGDDILGQTKSDWIWDSGTSAWVMGTVYDTEYLLVDGQGSTRQLSRSDLSVAESYNYDGYGILLGGNPTPAAPAATKLLYTGEQFDTAAQSYYLRARYYDPLNGRFTQMDPYAGNTSDPQSLHKYLYCHANPVNGIDPSGNSMIANVTTQIAIRAIIASVVFGTMSFAFAKANGATWSQALWAGLQTAAITGLVFISPLFAWCMLAITPMLLALNIYSGDLTGKDIPEIVAYLAAGIALMLLFKSPGYQIWEIKTVLKSKIPQALNNLEAGTTMTPKTARTWQKAKMSGNKSAQGTCIHKELADIMRNEGISIWG